MRFRPCIDIHDGKVKQIVGSSLTDSGAVENFVSARDAAYYAQLYREKGLYGGHAILLNKRGTPEYQADKVQAFGALRAFEGGIQAGGGINAENAAEFIENGASHVIVTSAVFHGGKLDMDSLKELSRKVGKERLVLDLSVKSRDGRFYIVTDRWQKFTDVELNSRTMEELAGYCDEYLVHAVDGEGKQNGICREAVEILAGSPIPAVYAGGISSYEDIELIREYGKDRVDFTIGSALDLFGGSLAFDEVIARCS